MRTALANKEPKKALELEVKKLDNLLAMVREPADEKARRAGAGGAAGADGHGQEEQWN